MLGDVGSTNLDVELVASVTTTDDNRAANEGAEGFEDFLAELLQGWNRGTGGRVPVSQKN